MRATRYAITLYLAEADTQKVPLSAVTRAIAKVLLSAGLSGRWATVSHEETGEIPEDELSPDVAAHLGES